MNRRPPWTFDIHLTCYHFIDDTHKITLIASSIERFNAVISTDGGFVTDYYIASCWGVGMSGLVGYEHLLWLFSDTRFVTFWIIFTVKVRVLDLIMTVFILLSSILLHLIGTISRLTCACFRTVLYTKIINL